MNSATAPACSATSRLRANVTAHTRHAAESSGSSCYNCHMPYTTYGLLKTIRSHTVSSPSVTESVRDRPAERVQPLSSRQDACAGPRTRSRTGSLRRRRPSRADQDAIAASLLWSLRGDAGQRAILAQALGWPPAQQASGTGWMAPYLAQLLNDPYDAVRFIAARSLRTLPGFTALQYDFIAPERQRRDAQLRAMAIWDRGRVADRRTEPQLLIDGRGDLRVSELLRLIGERDASRVLLRE